MHSGGFHASFLTPVSLQALSFRLSHLLGYTVNLLLLFQNLVDISHLLSFFYPILFGLMGSPILEPFNHHFNEFTGDSKDQGIYSIQHFKLGFPMHRNELKYTSSVVLPTHGWCLQHYLPYTESF